MAAMREFGQAADHKAKKKKSVEFKLDGDVLRAVQPKNAVLVHLATLPEDADDLQVVATFVGFMNNVLDRPSRVLLNRRLNDPEDDLDLDSDEMRDLMEYLVEELIPTPDPTGPSSGATARRRQTGAGSRGRATGKV